jgi:hypothetical protein
MNVYRALPLFNDVGQFLAVMVETGSIEDRPDGAYVRCTEGYEVLYDGDWFHSRGVAWDACADRIEAMAASLREQADACRMRAAEEVLT